MPTSHGAIQMPARRPAALMRDTRPARSLNRPDEISQSPTHASYPSSICTMPTGRSSDAIASRLASTSPSVTSEKYWYHEHHTGGITGARGSPAPEEKPSAHRPSAAGRPPGPESASSVTGASPDMTRAEPRSTPWMTGTPSGSPAVAPNTVTGPPSSGSTARTPEPWNTPSGAGRRYWQSMASESGHVTGGGGSVTGKTPVTLQDCQPSAYTWARAGSTGTVATCFIRVIPAPSRHCPLSCCPPWRRSYDPVQHHRPQPFPHITAQPVLPHLQQSSWPGPRSDFHEDGRDGYAEPALGLTRQISLEPARDSPGQSSHDDLVELMIGGYFFHGLERVGTAELPLDGEVQRGEVAQHLLEPLPSLHGRLLIGGRPSVVRRPPPRAGMAEHSSGCISVIVGGAGVRNEHEKGARSRLDPFAEFLPQVGTVQGLVRDHKVPVHDDHHFESVPPADCSGN